MKRTIIIVALVVLSFSLLAQNNIETVLREVEKNNTTLSAYRKSVDADKIGNKRGLNPSNPEVSFNYLWSNPSVMSNRTDFSVTQSIDFPTVYRYQSQISDIKNDQADLEYQKQRNELLFQTREVCIKLIHFNRLKAELSRQFDIAKRVAESNKIKYAAGEISILDHNKAQIDFLNVSKAFEIMEIEHSTLLLELANLNGGNTIKFTENEYETKSIPVDFEQWFAQAALNNPLLQWVKHEVALSSKEAQLSVATSLPKLSGGYMSESVVGQQLRGVTFGISIPLWENKNTVKYAKAKAVAMQGMELDARLKFYNNMKTAHHKAVAMQKSIDDYRIKLSLYSNYELIDKAFNKGEISLTDYLHEFNHYYESIFKLLEMEKELNLALAEINRFQ